MSGMKNIKRGVAVVALALGLLAGSQVGAQNERQWWSQSEWSDHSPGTWNDTGESIQSSDPSADDANDATPYAAVRKSYDQSPWDMTDDWFTDNYWTNRFESHLADATNTNGWAYPDSAWDYDSNYWKDTWDN